MKFILIVVLSFFYFINANAQIENLPSFENIDGVYKTVVDKKLYPLLLKMNISESKNAEDFKDLISNLNYFELYDSKKENSGKILLENVTEFLVSNNYKCLKENIYKKENEDNKEFIIVKKSADSVDSATVFALVTSKKYKANSLNLL